MAGNTHDPRPVTGDLALAGGADMLMQVDHAARAEHASSPRDRSAVIAVRRGRNSHFSGRVAMRSGNQCRGTGVAPTECRQVLLQDHQHRVGATQRLEALQPQPLAFVFVTDPLQEEAARQPVQRHEWRRCVIGPCCDLGPRRTEPSEAQHGTLLAAVFAIARRAGVVDQACGKQGQLHEGPSRLARGDELAPNFCIVVRNHIRNERAAMELDSFDRKLLRAVQANNQLNAEALGDAVGLSPSACLRRLRRLRDAGVIESEIAVVAPETLGRALMMVVEVTLEREQPDLMDAFKRSMRGTPEVMLCLYVTGEVDFVLIVTAKTMHDYEDFTRRFFFDNPNVRRFNTRVVMDRVKFGLSVPIDPD